MKVGYARASTFDPSCEIQAEALRTAGCQKIFTDIELGRDFGSRQLGACFEALEEGDKLIIWRLDRLGFSVKQLIKIVRGLNERSVELASLSENIDTSGLNGSIVLNLFTALSDLERYRISERTKERLAEVRKLGRKGGRPKKLNEKQLKMAKTMLSKPEHTVTSVARKLGVGRNTLYRYLNS